MSKPDAKSQAPAKDIQAAEPPPTPIGAASAGNPDAARAVVLPAPASPPPDPHHGVGGLYTVTVAGGPRELVERTQHASTINPQADK